MTGPLAGIVVIEAAGLGAAPFGGMMLADMGADVIRIDRPSGTAIPVPGPNAAAVVDRGRRSLAIDLKHPDATAVVQRLVSDADVFIEGNRPGVMESLGLGPDVLLGANPRLIYGRLTGFGQQGPMATRAGHDLNAIGLSGALAAIGRHGQPPTPPLSLLGDFAGGGLMLAYGVVCALVSRATTGRGQVVDASILDGSATLMAPYYAWAALGGWSTERGTNIIDSGAPYYDAYETRDAKWLAVAAIEPKFYAAFVATLGLDAGALGGQNDRARWPEQRRVFADTIASATRSEWTQRFANVDACVTPVLELDEVAEHPLHTARKSFVTIDGLVQPVPSPRLSETPGAAGVPGPAPGTHTRELLTAAGFTDSDVDGLVERGVVTERS